MFSRLLKNGKKFSQALITGYLTAIYLYYIKNMIIQTFLTRFEKFKTKNTYLYNLIYIRHNVASKKLE